MRLLAVLGKPAWRGALRGLVCAGLVWVVCIGFSTFRGLED